ncbi:membrane-spanning 4-domains subfamily A member 4A-like [Ptychodera flava]|uniref:membrane-spanning 4-domains subfamily A member 4A-like n=1 Tax=Ptychodera flava TaxID=63121 RepID=UPI00396A760B
MQPQQHEQSQSQVQVLQTYAPQQFQPTIRNGTRPGFAKRTITALSFCQFLLGGTTVALGIVAIVIECVSSEIGCGIWCGVFFMVSGLLGLISASKKTNGLIITSMVLSVVSASLFAPVLLSASVAMIFQEEYGNDDYFYYDACLVVESLLGLMAATEAVIAIISSAFCCRAVCCDPPPIMMHGVPIERRSIQQEESNEHMGLLSNQYVVSSDLPWEHHRPDHNRPTDQTICTGTSSATPRDVNVLGYQQRADFTTPEPPQLKNHQ